MRKRLVKRDSSRLGYIVSKNSLLFQEWRRNFLVMKMLRIRNWYVTSWLNETHNVEFPYSLEYQSSVKRSFKERISENDCTWKKVALTFYYYVSVRTENLAWLRLAAVIGARQDLIGPTLIALSHSSLKFSVIKSRGTN